MRNIFIILRGGQRILKHDSKDKNYKDKNKYNFIKIKM